MAQLLTFSGLDLHLEPRVAIYARPLLECIKIVDALKAKLYGVQDCPDLRTASARLNSLLVATLSIDTTLDEFTRRYKKALETTGLLDIAGHVALTYSNQVPRRFHREESRVIVNLLREYAALVETAFPGVKFDARLTVPQTRVKSSKRPRELSDDSDESDDSSDDE
jgi:hypothetical protein